jgi:hypothetical protein
VLWIAQKCTLGMHRRAKRIYDSQNSAQHLREEKNAQRKALRDAWSSFAEKYVADSACADLFGQAWFATLTTQYTLTLPSARRAAQRFADVAKRKGHTIALCWFAERYELKDGFHLHALVASTATRAELNEYWSTATRANKSHALQIANQNNIAITDAIFASDNEPHLRELMQNRSNFQPLKRGLKGGAYASKYITKGGHTTDYDIIL